MNIQESFDALTPFEQKALEAFANEQADIEEDAETRNWMFETVIKNGLIAHANGKSIAEQRQGWLKFCESCARFTERQGQTDTSEGDRLMQVIDVIDAADLSSEGTQALVGWLQKKKEVAQ